MSNRFNDSTGTSGRLWCAEKNGDNNTLYTAQMLKFDPVVPPKSNALHPWEYDKELYKRCNEIERLFRLIQGFRRVFCRFDKLDLIYISFVQLALIYLAIK